MKKRDVLVFSLILSLLISISLIAAATNSTNSTTTTNSGNPYEKSYNCLKEQIDARTYGSMTLEELSFALMALGFEGTRQTDLVSELEKRKSTNADCWPNNGCTIKDTAQVMLAYNQINKNTDAIKSWLMNQTGPTSDLVWYLQIETVNQSTCKITYDNQSRSISISDKKVISGNPGTCLKSAYNGYWLEISENCYNKDFKISCSNDFLTSIFYKKKGGSTYYVTSTTQQQSPNGETTQKVESICFKQSGSCNYEGSLWATMAITKKDASIRDKLIPYLITLSQESANKRYIPSAFLYAISAFDEYFSELTLAQNSKGYWQLSDSTKRYYDTGIALLGLMGRVDSEQFTRAREYLLDPTVQGTGCWNGNSIRDTSFLLTVLDPKVGTSQGSPTTCASYADQGYSCMSSGECENINGSQLGNYYCFGASVCCDKQKPAEKTCSEKGGVVCTFGQECSTGNMVSASGTSLCCLSGTCSEPTPTPGISACESDGYTCKDSITGCDSTEEEKSLSCPENGICCSLKVVEDKSYWWLWLLIILIILIILAIVFRNQVQMWYFRVKNKFSKQPVNPQQRPPQQSMMGMPRQIIPGQMPPRPMPPRGMPPRPGLPFPKQRELDDTLKKLKDMGNK